MEPIGEMPCVFVESGCTWKTPTHHLITTREYVRAHATKCLYNRLVQQTRQRTLEEEEAEMQSQIEAELRQDNMEKTLSRRRKGAQLTARQEGAGTKETTRTNHQGQDTAKGDMP